VTLGAGAEESFRRETLEPEATEPVVGRNGGTLEIEAEGTDGIVGQPVADGGFRVLRECGRR
jgi:hypothetical protein